MSAPKHDFDDSAILAMAIAYERTCSSLQSPGIATTVREIIGKQIIEAAKQGERDPNILYQQALQALGIEETQTAA
jgi:hypothetical protein